GAGRADPGLAGGAAGAPAGIALVHLPVAVVVYLVADFQGGRVHGRVAVVAVAALVDVPRGLRAGVLGDVRLAEAVPVRVPEPQHRRGAGRQAEVDPGGGVAGRRRDRVEGRRELRVPTLGVVTLEPQAGAQAGGEQRTRRQHPDAVARRPVTRIDVAHRAHVPAAVVDGDFVAPEIVGASPGLGRNLPGDRRRVRQDEVDPAGGLTGGRGRHGSPLAPEVGSGRGPVPRLGRVGWAVVLL